MSLTNFRNCYAPVNVVKAILVHFSKKSGRLSSVGSESSFLINEEILRKRCLRSVDDEIEIAGGTTLAMQPMSTALKTANFILEQCFISGRITKLREAGQV